MLGVEPAVYATARPCHPRSAYLALERSSQTKHEFVGGQILAMAGAKPRHNLVASNTALALQTRLRDRCAVLSSGQRVTVEATGDSSRTAEHHRRLDTGQWLVTEVAADSVLELGVGTRIPLAELFTGIDRVPDV